MICNPTIVFLVALTIGGYSSLASSEQLAVDFTSKNGNQIQVPFFSSDLTSVDPELKEFLVTDTKVVLEMIGKTLISRLTAKKSAFSALQGGYAWTKLATQIGMIARSQESKRPASAKTILGIRNAFNKAMQSMFKRAQEASKAINLKGTPKEPQVLAEQLEMFISDFIETIEASPVASYNDWSRATVNGEPFEQQMAELMAKLSYNGYSPVFTSIEMLLNLLVKLSGSKSSQ